MIPSPRHRSGALRERRGGDVRTGAEGPLSARTARGGVRGFTLIELLVVVVLAALMMTAVVSGMGAATNARLKGATTLVSAAIRSAYTRASATAKPTRVVFDFVGKRIWIEEADSKMLVQEGDYSKTGGANPATDVERKAAAETEKILKGPKPPKTSFKAIKNSGIEEDGSATGRGLGSGIRFREVMVSHQPEAVREGRAYLYFWPGGITELAYIQLAKGETPTDDDTMTLIVHPLTGKVKVLPGAKTIRTDADSASEREDRIF